MPEHKNLQNGRPPISVNETPVGPVTPDGPAAFDHLQLKMAAYNGEELFIV